MCVKIDGYIFFAFVQAGSEARDEQPDKKKLMGCRLMRKRGVGVVVKGDRECWTKDKRSRHMRKRDGHTGLDWDDQEV